MVCERILNERVSTSTHRLIPEVISLFNLEHGFVLIQPLLHLVYQCILLLNPAVSLLQLLLKLVVLAQKCFDVFFLLCWRVDLGGRLTFLD